jgi:hypothetical protein
VLRGDAAQLARDVIHDALPDDFTDEEIDQAFDWARAADIVEGESRVVEGLGFD